ncbi:hypothetical protein [Microvirga roseola]|uniref:hypothetical protein n=1 Tax=Microvirga roseola TaxID=2883126 RepID=UPI001E5B7993|nr:hypothetical protein [Microvirga roseola]
MNINKVLRQETRQALDGAREMIRHYNGLYPHEDLVRDVLRICDRLTPALIPHPRLDETRRIVEERCGFLVRVANRFSERDPASIALARAQAISAVDLFQDAVLALRRASIPVPRTGMLLRRKSL